MFRLLISSDSNIETGVGHASLALATTNFYKYIENQNYGTTLSRIAVFFICWDPNLAFKQRIRYKKDSKELYMDIMLDYNLFTKMTPDERISELCRKLLIEVPPIVNKYKFKDFDSDKLMTSLESWFVNHNFI